jgi:2-polyprenyl-6-methoxyphenol hydroxylase-like FAD-dependent oxidoreductase
MDGFKRMFGNSNSLLREFRNVGIGVADRVGPIKNLLARTAMGRSGELPNLTKSRSKLG